MLSHILQRVRLVKLERVTRLRVNIDPYNVEAGPSVPSAGSSCTAEKI
jgi:hypothetical protein